MTSFHLSTHTSTERPRWRVEWHENTTRFTVSIYAGEAGVTVAGVDAEDLEQLRATCERSLRRLRLGDWRAGESEPPVFEDDDVFEPEDPAGS